SYSIDNGTTYHTTNEFTNLIADTYIVRVMDGNGCMVLTAFNPVVVEDLQASDIVINSTPDYGTVCVGEIVVLEAIAVDAVSYTWEDGSTEAIREVTSDTPGTVIFTVTVVNESGCTSEKSIEIFFDECIGLPELNVDAMTVTIYPNPNTGIFTLELTGVNQEIKVSVIDFAGRLILEKDIVDYTENKIEKQFDLNDYERGIYFLRIIHGDKTSYKKVVIQ
ncbi:MAG: T9SS type A sorting domain-containing protein, partial [Bacteroidales bacterium]|nr:T9SS type A sorting domain-containing protein [Bacteroidales bacterium]